MRFGAVAWGSWSWVTVRDRASGAGDGQGIDHFQICGLAVGLFNSLPGGGARIAPTWTRRFRVFLSALRKGRSYVVLLFCICRR